MKNMTALMSAFLRYYHYKNNKYKIYNDEYAKYIISEEEYNMISKYLAEGIKFFDPKFVGNDEEKIRHIINNYLSSTILGRSAFCYTSLKNAIKIGCKQYLIYASGYDMSSYKFNIKTFEIDKKDIIEDKKTRLNKNSIANSNINYIDCDFTNKDWINNIINSSYNKNEISFNSLLGISYYLTKEEFTNMIKSISSIIKSGSSIIFDYPNNYETISSNKNKELAYSANEDMKSTFTYEEIEEILYQNGLLIYEHLNSNEITEKYFSRYNILNPNSRIIADKSINYCLAVKKSL